MNTKLLLQKAGEWLRVHAKQLWIICTRRAPLPCPSAVRSMTVSRMRRIIELYLCIPNRKCGGIIVSQDHLSLVLIDLL